MPFAQLGRFLQRSVAPASSSHFIFVQSWLQHGAHLFAAPPLLETGALGPFSAYLSGSKIKGDLWRGPGTIDREHVDQSYRQAINQRTDYLFGLTDRIEFGQSWRLTTTAYYEDKDGYGVSPEAYATSLNRYNSERTVVAGLFALSRPLSRLSSSLHYS